MQFYVALNMGQNLHFSPFMLVAEILSTYYRVCYYVRLKETIIGEVAYIIILWKPCAYSSSW